MGKCFANSGVLIKKRLSLRTKNVTLRNCELRSLGFRNGDRPKLADRARVRHVSCYFLSKIWLVLRIHMEPTVSSTSSNMAMADTAAGKRSVRAGGQLSNLRERAALSGLRKILYAERKFARTDFC